jgi:prevent-host-death family protein
VKTVNIHEAKTHLSRLLKQVEDGNEVLIARGGQPVARLVPYNAQPGRRMLGNDRQTVRIADDFDAPLPDDLLADFDA